MIMRTKTGRRLARRCGGWGTTEYLVVLAVFVAMLEGSDEILELIREHHQEFSWALMVPF